MYFLCVCICLSKNDFCEMCVIFSAHALSPLYIYIYFSVLLKIFMGYCNSRDSLMFLREKIDILAKRWSAHARGRYSLLDLQVRERGRRGSVPLYLPRSIHISLVVRPDFSIHLSLSVSLLSHRFFFVYLVSLCVYVSSVDAVEYDKVEFQHGTFALVCAP